MTEQTLLQANILADRIKRRSDMMEVLKKYEGRHMSASVPSVTGNMTLKMEIDSDLNKKLIALLEYEIASDRNEFDNL